MFLIRLGNAKTLASFKEDGRSFHTSSVAAKERYKASLAFFRHRISNIVISRHQKPSDKRTRTKTSSSLLAWS